MRIKYPPGATALSLDERESLIPSHITTQAELNEWEAANILKAQEWLFSKSEHSDFLTIAFVKKLHKKMFNETWHWAGNLRNTEKNIGVSPENISTELKNLLDDVRYQIVNQVYDIDEIAYRFHHRLVWIHPFANGNGRHARLMTDLLLIQAGEPRFTWGKISLIEENATRKKYIAALQAADKHDYSLLATFVRD